jgi:hypothetical protein
MKRLDLEVDKQQSVGSRLSTTTEILPELFGVEEALKLLAAAMDALKNPDLEKVEILQLRSLVQAVNLYHIRIAEFIDYRGK